MLPGDAIKSLGESFRGTGAAGIAEFAAEGLEGKVQRARTLDMRNRSQGYELDVEYNEKYP